MLRKFKIFNISFAFLSLMITFVINTNKSRQVLIFIKYLLNLGKQEEFCFILHKTDFRNDFFNSLNPFVIKPL